MSDREELEFVGEVSDTEYCRFGYLKDGILLGIYKIDFVDEDIALRIMEQRFAFQKESSDLAIADVSMIKYTTKDARKSLSSDKAQKGIVALAILNKTPLSNILGNFYLKFLVKNSLQAKMFDDLENARKWLLSLNH